MRQLILLFIFFSTFSFTKAEETFDIDFPDIVVQDVNYELFIEYPSTKRVEKLLFNQQEVDFKQNENGLNLQYVFDEHQTIEISLDENTIVKEVDAIPLWFSLMPPLIAIFLALIFREVVTALLIGIFSGAACIMIYQEGLWGWLLGFMRMIDTYIIGALNDQGHLSIIIFSTLIGGMVSVISKNGGMQGVVNGISKYANNARSGQLATWFLGIAIFFDDYANTLIVGNTMRPVTDRLKISREKLAYLVDSTAAPMASIAFITTWIGAELGYISSGIASIAEIDEGVYSIFLNSLAYSFYPILALVFMLILIWREKDFGPMQKAEQLARNNLAIDQGNTLEANDDEFTIKQGIKPNAMMAIVPIVIVISGTIIGLLYTGYDRELLSEEGLTFSRKLSIIIGNADSYLALLWSSAAGLIAAVKMSVLSKKLSLKQSIESSLSGFKTMLTAVVILILAWSLAAVIEDLHTADLLTQLLSNSISAQLIPAFTFVLAALVAFSTGSSWGTMAILYPLMLPAAWKISQESGLDYVDSMSILYNSVSAVLAGAVLGDHCSPISDTTILSSLASSCNHIEHVRTQLPYAITVGIVALLIGTIPTAYGLSSWIAFPMGGLLLYLIVEKFGKKTVVA